MGYSVFPAPSSGIAVSDLITQPAFTTVASSSASNVSSVTISGLSGYNVYRVWITNFLPTSAGDFPFIRFNGDSSSSYSYNLRGDKDPSNPWGYWFSGGLTSKYYLSFTGNYNAGYYGGGYIDISNANSTSTKHIRSSYNGVNQNAQGYTSIGDGIYTGSSTISSITIACDSGANFYMNQIYVFGAK